MLLRLLTYFSIANLLCAVLIFIPALHTVLWMVKIVLTQWGHWLAVLSCLLGLIAALFYFQDRFWVSLSFFVAAVIYLLPALDTIGRIPFPGLSLWFSDPLPKVNRRTLAFRHAETDLPIELYSDPKDLSFRPLVIVVHGGSWGKGNRNDLPELNFFLAHAGFRVAAVSYRLAPQHRFPAPIEDVLAATDFLLEHREEFRIEPTVFFFGRSAGGQIAEISALEKSVNNFNVAGVIGLYAPADLIWGYENSRSWHIIDGQQTIGEYLGAPLTAQNRADYEKASPVFRVGPQGPPHLLLHGIDDELVSIHHTRTFAERLKVLGRQVQVEELRFAPHGFDYFYQGPGSRVLRTLVVNFLKTRSQ